MPPSPPTIPPPPPRTAAGIDSRVSGEHRYLRPSAA